MNRPLENLNPKQQRVVRTKVRELLGQSEAFGTMPDADRRAVANKLVDVVAYLADPAAGDQDLAQSLSSSTTPGNKAKHQTQYTNVKEGIVQNDFDNAATSKAGQTMQEMKDAVGFVEFVGGLIKGVFQSIVDASIQQMEAYQELLSNVVKSLNQFATDNFTENQGRDYLANRFPSMLNLNTAGQQPRLSFTDQAEDEGFGELRSALGMGEDEEIDLDDEESEAELARRGRLEMAKLRQKQLATMVLLGINRIVVTNGRINAKVKINVSAEDTASRRATASSYDRERTSTRSRQGGWFSDYDSTRNHRTTINTSRTTDTSESSITADAQLTGDVRVNFKSETFPLEQLASQTELDAVNTATNQQ